MRFYSIAKFRGEAEVIAIVVVMTVLVGIVAASGPFWYRTARASGKSPPAGTITSPVADHTVSRGTIVEGSLSEIPDSNYVWLDVFDPKTHLSFPKEPVAVHQNFRQRVVEAGALHVVTIRLLLVSGPMDAEISAWRYRGLKEGRFPGLDLSKLPGTIQVLDQVTVQLE